MLLAESADCNVADAPCPRCGCRGALVGHGAYRRRLVGLDGEREVCVPRVRCTMCRATHAVIPPDVVPRRAYAESLVAAVVEAAASGASNSQVRAMFGLPETTRRRIMALTWPRACLLLAAGPSRRAVGAALEAAGGAAALCAAHLAEFGARLSQRVRLSSAPGARAPRPRPST